MTEHFSSHKTSIFMVAGEASADMHGAKVLEALKKQFPDLYAFGVGGEQMQQQGFHAAVAAKDVSLAGLTEVLLAIPRILRIMRQLEQLVREQRPNVIVLIDLPDFNLRLAKRLRALGIPIVYYISPQVWAWRQKRVLKIRQLVDKMLVILPFEQQFYEQYQIPVQFVGHPLVEQLPAEPDQQAARKQLQLPAQTSSMVALLPGSRHSEVTRLLPTMLAGVRLLQNDLPELQSIIPVANTVDRSEIEKIVAASGVRATIINGHATEVLTAADAVVVCSGTATLQTALLKRPMVVVYRVSWLTYQILRRLIKVANIALVNLIAGRALVAELIQDKFTPESVAHELRDLLQNKQRRQDLLQAFQELRQTLGRGDTAQQVAHAITDYLPKPLPLAAPKGSNP